MVQLCPSAVTCLLFLVTSSENKTKTFQPPGQKLGQQKIRILLIEKYEHKNYWAGRHQMKAMSLEQSWSIKNGLIFFFFSQELFLGLFSLSVETKSWNRDRFDDKLPAELQCLDELVIEPQ